MRRLLSIEQAAEVLGVHPRTVRRYISRGILIGYRVGPRLVKVDLTDVEQLARPIPTAGGDAA